MTGRLKVAPALAGLGVLRLSGGVPEGTEQLPEKSRIDAEVFYSSLHHLRGVRDEMLAWDESAAQARHARSLGERPLIVLSATEPRSGWVSALQFLHRDLSRLSTRGEHRLVEGSNHRTILIGEGPSRATAAAIAEVVDAVRS